MEDRPSILARARRRLRGVVSGRSGRDWLVALWPWMAVVAGLALALVAALPEVTRVDATILAGEVAPQTADTYPFPHENYTFATFTFRERPNCGLLLFVLDEDQAGRFEETGDLPDVEEALYCDAPQGTFHRPVALVVFENRFDQPFEYDVAVETFLVRQPWALLALPALVLFLGGIFPLLGRLLRRETAQLAEEHLERLRKRQKERERKR